MIRKHFRFKRLVLGFAFVVAIAVFSAPVVQATPTSGLGPRDPWAYNVIHRSTQANVAPAGKYGQLDSWAYNVIQRSTQANVASAGKYGQLDPWAYTVIHQSSPSVVTARPNNGFDYSDAGIGASVLFGAALFLLTALALGRRYRSRFDRSGLATS
jgi:hypothetical protein